MPIVKKNVQQRPPPKDTEPTQMDSVLSMIERRLAKLESDVASLRGQRNNPSTVVRASQKASEDISKGSLRILRFLAEAEEPTTRFQDVVRFAVSSGITEMCAESPSRHYSAIQSRMGTLNKKGLIKRSTYGRWSITLAGRSLMLDPTVGTSTEEIQVDDSSVDLGMPLEGLVSQDFEWRGPLPIPRPEPTLPQVRLCPIHYVELQGKGDKWVCPVDGEVVEQFLDGNVPLDPSAGEEL
jgi:hypothetical protein